MAERAGETGLQRHRGTAAGHRAGSRALPIFLAVFVGAVLTLAWPRWRATLHFLPVRTALNHYQSSRTIPSAQLEALIGLARESIAISDQYLFWDGLSQLYYLQGLDDKTSPWQRRPALRQSEKAALEAVRRAPALPRVWLRIAQVAAYLREPDEKILPALSMSIFTGRVEPTLLLARLEIGYRLIDLMDEETLALLQDQTVLTWKVRPDDFRAALKEGKIDFRKVKSLLSSGNRDILDAMEHSLAQDPA